MRRPGRTIRGILLAVASLAGNAAPAFAQGFLPVIAVPAYVEQFPRESQPLSAFRAPEPFLTAVRSAADEGPINLKVFLSQRSLLEPEPSRGQPLGLRISPSAPENADAPAVAIGLSFEPVAEEKPRPLSAAEAGAMPVEVADAVKLLLRKEPANRFAVKPRIRPEDVPQTPTSVRSALEVLRGTAKAPPPPAANFESLKDVDREAKLAAVIKQIAVLNESLAMPPAETLAPLIVTAAESARPVKIGEEEQDATRSAVAKAAAQLLGQLPEPPTRLPDTLPVTNLPPAPAPGPVTAAAPCATCGRPPMFGRPLHHLGEFSDSIGRCDSCGSGWRCSPGRTPCQPCEAHDGPLGRLFCNFYECLCCPDPCYEGKWEQVANASLFAEGARPITQTEVRWNASRGGIFPDRSEYIIARADGRGKGPMPLARFSGAQYDLDELVLITETAKDKLSVIVEMPYRAISPDSYIHGSGFGDMALGTKTLLFDCEMLQVSMQLKTYIPIGNTLKGVGNGHVSIEPSLLFALKLGRDTYFQGQISEWIPIGGDPIYAGSVLHSHFSLNHVLHRFGPEIPFVGTMEMNTFSFQDGAYTDPINGAFQKSSGTTYVSMGPGMRLFFCDKLDIGFGSAIALTGDHFSREYYRTSLRLRF